MKYINLGCGSKYSTDSVWLNVDMSSPSKDVIECNFLNGIPFKENEFDLVYHSHVIEHFSKDDGAKFIEECHRILKNQGIIRIVCPNLEVIAKEYLNNLERAFLGDEIGEQNYDWMMLELYDQTVREVSGGDMLNYFKRKDIQNIDFITSRIGDIAKVWHHDLSQTSTSSNITPIVTKKQNQFNIFKERKSSISLQEKYSEIGKFRRGGEIHQWMYDRFSLKRLLENTGFTDVIVRTAKESYIENWDSYHLDNPNESASIFIEAKKR